MDVNYLTFIKAYTLHCVKVSASVKSDLTGLHPATELSELYAVRIREKIEINRFRKSVRILIEPFYFYIESVRVQCVQYLNKSRCTQLITELFIADKINSDLIILSTNILYSVIKSASTKNNLLSKPKSIT